MKHQNFKSLLTMLAFLLFFVSSCSEDKENEAPAVDLIVDNTSVTLLQNDEITVTITSGNGGYSVKPVDPEIATATISGEKVTIKAPKDAELGETTILVLDERKKVAQIKVQVAQLWDLTVDKDEHEMFIGATVPVKIETGNGGYELSIEEGEDIIELGPLSGQVFTIKAITEGSAKVKIKDKKGEEKEISILVKVVDLEFNKYEVSLVGPSKTADVTITGGNGGYQFSYSVDGIATATEANNVITITSVAVGTTIITVTDQKGETKDIEVEVLPKEVQTNVSELTITGTKASNTFNITDGNGGYSVGSGDDDIATATISNNEVTVTAKKAGSATITVTDAQGKTKDVAITVNPMAMNLELNYCLIANYGALSNANDYKSMSQITLEVRFKLENARGLQGFIGLEGNLLLRGKEGNNSFPQSIELVSKLGNTENKMIAKTTLDKNVWYHLALVFDGTEPDLEKRHKLYINGVEETVFVSGSYTNNRTTVDLTKTNNAPGLGIGRVGENDWRGLNGVLAEARVWKVARTADQIKNNVCTLTEANPTGLVSHWIFGYGIETPLITDLVGTCDAVVYDNKSSNVVNPKIFPANKWVNVSCP